jgi:hypothetical protein
MSENKVRRAFRTTKVRVNKDTIPSKEQRDSLEGLFLTLEIAKTDAVASERAAEIAVAKAKTQRSKAQIAELELLQTAAGNFTQVAGEKFWIVYRDAEGIVTLEGFTERLLRNNLRAQQDMLGEKVANSSDEGIDRSGLYESEGEEDDVNPNDMN